MAVLTALPDTDEGRRQYALTNPATGAPAGSLVCSTPEDVGAAIARARAAQPAWQALGVAERSARVLRALESLIDRSEEIVDTIVSESGKPRNEAVMIDLFAGADALAYHARHAPKWLRPTSTRTHGVLRATKRVELRYQPLGVVGVISPWNGPLILALNPAVQALLAGNTVVIKPSEITPASGALAAEILRSGGIPDDVVQTVPGDGGTGAALVEGGVDKIHFTGSVATGRRIAESCGRQLIPCTLELGGNDAMIVCSDADLDRAAAGAVAGSMVNSGQYCCGTERVYVMEDVAEEFTRKVVERVAALRQDTTGEFDVGPMFFGPQLDKVDAQVRDAVAAGATALIGGGRNQTLECGLFYEPTVLVDVTADMDVMKEETFGPVVPIVTVGDVEEALELANDSAYGLSGSVWTSDVDAGIAIAERMRTGSVSINDMAVTYGIPEAPFGGRGDSGVGQANGEIGVKGFCHTQPIIIDRFGGRQVTQHYPYTEATERTMMRLIRGLWAKGAKRFSR